MKRSVRAIAALVSFLTLVSTGASQSLNLPQASPKATVSQTIGVTEVSVVYHRPSVKGREIWGTLVPYGTNNLGFGTSTEAPWRAGANENTLITFQHDARVGGKPIPAGTYGLHMIIQEDDTATVIFSKDTRSWGSYFYDPAHDATRVDVAIEDAPHTEMLTYAFSDIDDDSATLALLWEKKRIPIPIEVDTVAITTAELKEQMKSTPGFYYQNLVRASQYLRNNDGDLELALQWADAAVSAPFIGNRNFATLSNKADTLTALGRASESEAIMQEALQLGSATDLHQYGRRLINEGKKQEALAVFKTNAERHPGQWPTNVGLARGYSAVGDYEKALEHMQLAQKNIPEGDTVNPPAIAAAIEKLKKGEDIN